MTWRRVLRSDELPLGEGGGSGGTRLRDEALATTIGVPTIRDVRVGRADILLTRLVTGEAVAFAASCPHQAVSLKTASVFDGYVRCPQHYYLYDPRSGRNILPTNDAPPSALCRLKPGYLTTYPLEERDGWIWVDSRANPPPAGYDAELEAGDGPERASADAAPVPRPPSGAEPVDHPTESVTAEAGTAIELVLVTSVRPGHLWRVEVSGPQVVVIGQVFQQGEQCAYRLLLAAREAGQATIRCVYAQPWSDRPTETRTYSVRVSG